jgi:GT2 family glycosyltransferase
MKPDLSVIYVNFNTTDLLRESLQSLRDHSAEVSYEAIVVDNASDEPPELDSSVKLIRSKENLGFGRGNNRGIGEAEGNFLLFLNTDAFISAETKLSEIVEYLRAHPKVGALLPRLVDREGRVQPTQVAHDPSLWRVLLDKPLRLLPSSLRRSFGWVNLDFNLPTEPTAVAVAVAAALFVRRDVFEQIGGFDPGFFMFFEDSDLCRRIRKEGYAVEFHPEWQITHLWGSSISSDRKRKELYFQSQQRYFSKHAGTPTRIMAGALRPLYVMAQRLRGRGY